ncbi:Eco57I restriction-modification methylase domain-containing protein [Sphingomonas sp. UYAg733]
MTPDRFKPLLDREFLKGELHYEFQDYDAAGKDAALKARLSQWVGREIKRETQAEASFIQRFFVETWGYREDGTGTDGFHLHPKFSIAGAGQTGNRGEADLALGNFGTGGGSLIPQIVCEFKDVQSALDAPQNRKGNTRSPVYQARDYLWNARRGLFGNEAVQPRFAIVTDMNEFRLYWWDHFPDRYLRFKVTGGDLFNQVTLLGDDAEARFDRFLFWRLFQPDMLLSDAGRTRLERLIEKQGKAEQKLEGDFYAHYRTYREVLIHHMLLQRPVGMTRGATVRLAQKLLDRLIFVIFAEDMGGRVGFPAGELQAQLKRFSEDSFLEPNGDEVWRRLIQIFRSMNDGGALGAHTIHQFNGGLFATDAAIDGLSLPNHIFVQRGQGRNDASLSEHKQTLYFLSATYNFAREGDAKNSIGLYTLGHIFEQSIVELEKLEADAEDRTSLTDVTKRKRDGVYYTPEWAVRRIIEETIDPLFLRWKAEAGWPDLGLPSRKAAAAYWKRLQGIRILDPACGSGAFLIVALKHLEREFAATVSAASSAGAIAKAPDEAAITKMILAGNLFGVDINPASVEITKLSLWLHTAMPNTPLSGLDGTIRCGNSLVDQRFYNKRNILDAEERDRINTFEWDGDFAPGSFDAVIGNPPYVKLQNFKQVNADMAAWLVSGSSGEAPYVSTGTGNFDLYLPFIEKGLTLLNAGGRMGYIAPNLWPTLEYGAGLRALVHAGRNLEKWLDFRSFQVFEEATVYTAIQIFSKAPVDAVQLAFAGDGDISRVDWHDPDYRLPYDDIQLPLAPWLIAPAPVRRMIERLGRDALRLDQPENVKAIFQGIITSADHIFHLQRLGRNRYSYTPRERGKKLAPVVVEIEDAIMKPLISGAEAKRFIEPRTGTYLLFPYNVDAGGPRLLTATEMTAQFPKAWKYLRQFEPELRAREGKKFDDAAWYRMGRNQNLDKQQLPKLLVAQLVPDLRLAFDDSGQFFINNVRVNGILPRGDNGWFLLGMLNAPVSNYIFKWLGKPKDNGYFEANKQFIAPLPIPHADRTSRAALSALAKGMQQRHTQRVDLRTRLDERLATTARALWPLERLLPDVRPVPVIEQTGPVSLPSSERKRWVDDQRKADEEAALARIDGMIRLDSELAIQLADGKLALLIDEQPAARVFVSASESALVAAQWRNVTLDFQPRGKDDAKRLIDRLRRVATSAEPAIEEQIIAIGDKLATLGSVIHDDEEQLHQLTSAMFGLTPEEQRLVETRRS